MEYVQKNRALLDKERQMRELRSARIQADQMENYLGSLNSANRGAPDHRRRIEELVKRAVQPGQPDLPPTTGPGEALRYFPTSYPDLRRAVAN